MTTYKAKSIMISRGKSGRDDSVRPCMISIFNVNNPHKSGKAPEKVVDFSKIEEVDVLGCGEVRYLLAGNDILVDDIKSVNIEKKGKKILLKIK